MRDVCPYMRGATGDRDAERHELLVDLGRRLEATRVLPCCVDPQRHRRHTTGQIYAPHGVSSAGWAHHRPARTPSNWSRVACSLQIVRPSQSINCHSPRMMNPFEGGESEAFSKTGLLGSVGPLYRCWWTLEEGLLVVLARGRRAAKDILSGHP